MCLNTAIMPLGVTTMETLTQASVEGIGNFIHNVASDIIRMANVSEEKGYSLVARYATLTVHNYTRGSSSVDAADDIIAARIRANKRL
jgi:hypothetical protein